MNKTAVQEFGAWVREMRIDKGWTQTKLADELGFPNCQSITMIENGNARLPERIWPQFIKLFKVDKEFFYQMMLKEKEEKLRNIIYRGGKRNGLGN